MKVWIGPFSTHGQQQGGKKVNKRHRSRDALSGSCAVNSSALAVGLKYMGKVGAPPALSLQSLCFLLMSAFCLLIVGKAEIQVLGSLECKSALCTS